MRSSAFGRDAITTAQVRKIRKAALLPQDRFPGRRFGNPAFSFIVIRSQTGNGIPPPARAESRSSHGAQDYKILIANDSLGHEKANHAPGA